MRNKRTSIALFAALTIGMTHPVLAETTIRVTAAYPVWNEMYEGIVAAFEKEYPDIHVDLDSNSQNFETLSEQTLRDAIVGNLPDITITGSNQIGPFVERGMAVDIEGYMKSDPDWEKVGYSNAAADTGRIGGRQYGLTVAAALPIIVYNKDLIEKAGGDPESFPGEWPEIIDLGNKVSASEPDAMGLFFEYHAGGAWTYQALVYSAGGRIGTPEGEIAFDSEEGLWALDLMRQIGETGQGAVDMTRDQGRQAFISGKVGAIVTSSGLLGNFQKQVGDRFSLGVTQLPVPSSEGRIPAGGLAAIMFSKEPEQADAAWKFMKYMMTPESQTFIVNTTKMVPFGTTTLKEFDPLFAEAVKGRENATQWYSFPGQNSIEIFEKMKNVFQQVVTLKVTPEEGMEQMKTEVAALLTNMN